MDKLNRWENEIEKVEEPRQIIKKGDDAEGKQSEDELSKEEICQLLKRDSVLQILSGMKKSDIQNAMKKYLEPQKAMEQGSKMWEEKKSEFIEYLQIKAEKFGRETMAEIGPVKMEMKENVTVHGIDPNVIFVNKSTVYAVHPNTPKKSSENEASTSTSAIKVEACVAEQEVSIPVVSPVLGCITCDACGMKLTTESNLNKHRWDEHGLKPHDYGCLICGAIFGRRYLLLKHRAQHRRKSDGCFECLACGKSFYVFKYFMSHLKSHSKYDENNNSFLSVD